MSDTPDHFDILIVGAGLSGVGAAVTLKRKFPGKSFAILEQRERVGGTWDLFRYPGVRCDSDMYTLGYRFKPWGGKEAIADGDKIRDYIEEAARENEILPLIRFGHKLLSADWSTEEAKWTLKSEKVGTGEEVTLTGTMVVFCSGYYRYDRGNDPKFDGKDEFEGTIAHPQFWPDDLDYEGKRVVVIGSGATAITLVPTLAEKAAHTTMLQRSPAYVVTRPSVDPMSKRLRFLPKKVGHKLTRWKALVMQQIIYGMSRRRPDRVKKLIDKWTRKELGPDYDYETHFTPRYNPWDERICVSKDGDFFEAIRQGKAEMVTDAVERFTKTGIKLESGREIEADIIVTATGLELVSFGGADVRLDGASIEPSDLISYRSILFAGLPNAAVVFGYAGASWTLKLELGVRYLCRLISHMDRVGKQVFLPVGVDDYGHKKMLLDLTAGYVKRGSKWIPRQGEEKPWDNPQNYFVDYRRLLIEPVDDDVLALREAGEPLPELLRSAPVQDQTAPSELSDA
ncbi:NAD(P)/FAD-dependent oxidoreductase [Henriciella sp. AS95]|uniref:flavin-containing monooxygenase n=1 Tax=Henriciella sp. AS95 TaxID=3135782 RepID=UPI00317C0B03